MHFCCVNERGGKELARRIQESVRSYDLTGRYGGEEFLIVLPGCWGDELFRICPAPLVCEFILALIPVA